jgi:hypothetical protein
VEPIIPAPGNGPWRIIILDRDPAGPKWILATVIIPSDVRSALLDAEGTYAGERAAAAWVARLTGRPVVLVPILDALAWRVDEGTQ